MNLNPIILKLRAQLTQPEGAGKLTRAEVLYLAELALERDGLRPWTGHGRDCNFWTGPRMNRACTCGFSAEEERVARKVAELTASG